MLLTEERALHLQTTDSRLTTIMAQLYGTILMEPNRNLHQGLAAFLMICLITENKVRS